MKIEGEMLRDFIEWLISRRYDIENEIEDFGVLKPLLNEVWRLLNFKKEDQ